MIGVYKIENKQNGKVYIGQSIDIKKRWASHLRELRKGIHDNIYLQDDWLIYGEGSFTFEIIKKCRSIKLDEIEKYYIDHYKATDRKYGYNRSAGLGKRLIDNRVIKGEEATRNYVVILQSDALHELCENCDYSCKQSCKSEIIMCKHLAETL